MITRTLDGAFLTAVANHPDVRPWLGHGDGPLDFTVAAGDPANLCLVTEHGGWFLHCLQPTIYEVHTLFLPEGRGKHAYAAAREMLRYVFTRTDALELWTRCPDDNGPARMLAAANGFKEWFRRENTWAAGVGVSHQCLTIDGWAMRDPAAWKAGQRFHEVIEAAKALAGSALPVHPEDVAHDRAAGAAWLMVNAGQTAKGVQWYNRWSVFGGYAPLQMLGHQVVDIQDAVVEVSQDRTTVLLVRQGDTCRPPQSPPPPP